MAMREEFDSTGQWLFRWRSFLPLVLIGIYVLALFEIKEAGHSRNFDLMWAGIAVFSQTWWLILICLLVFWIYYELIMFAEEEFLRGKFGQEYLGWAETTRAFFPRLSG